MGNSSDWSGLYGQTRREARPGVLAGRLDHDLGAAILARGRGLGELRREMAGPQVRARVEDDAYGSGRPGRDERAEQAGLGFFYFKKFMI